MENQSMVATVTKLASLQHDDDAADAATAPDLNEAIYLQVTELLAPDDVDRHLQKLMDMAEQLLEQVGQTGRPDDGDLLHQAHRLGGSAGLFGFERLLSSTRRFEHAVENGTGDVDGATAALLVATRRGLEIMRGMVAGRVVAV